MASRKNHSYSNYYGLSERAEAFVRYARDVFAHPDGRDHGVLHGERFLDAMELQRTLVFSFAMLLDATDLMFYLPGSPAKSAKMDPFGLRDLPIGKFSFTKHGAGEPVKHVAEIPFAERWREWCTQPIVAPLTMTTSLEDFGAISLDDTETGLARVLTTRQQFVRGELWTPAKLFVPRIQLALFAPTVKGLCGDFAFDLVALHQQKSVAVRVRNLHSIREHEQQTVAIIMPLVIHSGSSYMLNHHPVDDLPIADHARQYEIVCALLEARLAAESDHEPDHEQPADDSVELDASMAQTV